MIRTILLLGSLLAGLYIGEAAAADLGPAPAPMMPETDSMNFFGSGWYIRGDLGYSMPQGPKATYNGRPFDRLSVADSPLLGGGIGYKITNWFRADVTADYMFSGSLHGIYTIPNCCVFSDHTRLGGWALLANGYIDIG